MRHNLLYLFPLQLKVTVGNNGLHNNGPRGADVGHISLLQYQGIEPFLENYISHQGPGSASQFVSSWRRSQSENHLSGLYWKTSCLIPVPRKSGTKDSNDYRPVALMSHIIKTFVRLFLHLFRLELDPLQGSC